MIELLAGNAAFHWIATWSHPFLDGFFRVVTDLGYPLFYYLAIAPLFWIASRKRALVLFLLLLITALVNNEVKDFFQTARPDPNLVRVLDLRPIQGKSPSFPSGHAQLAAVFWWYLALWSERRTGKVLAAVVIGLICLSRVYLGAHFPIDVVGGLALGLALLFAVPLLDRWAEADFRAPLPTLLSVAALSIVLMLESSDPAGVTIYGCFLGLSILMLLPRTPLSLPTAGVRLAILFAGIAVQIGSAALLGQLAPSPTTDFTTGFRVALLWLIALWGYPWVVSQIQARRAPGVPVQA